MAFRVFLVLLSCFATFITTWIIVTITVAILGQSLGIRKLLARKLIDLFEWFARTEHKEEDETEVMESTFHELKHYRNSIKMPFHSFEVGDVVPFVQRVLDNINDDEVTKRFDSEELEIWNLLARNGKDVQLKSWKLKFAWFVGFLIRFFILLPCRLVYLMATLIFLALALTINQVILPFLFANPEHHVRKFASDHTYVTLFRLLARVLSVVVVSHGDSNPRNAKCVVANHTSPVDVMILSTNQAYTLVGQRQPGLFGFVQKCLSALGTQQHIWFDRTSATQRHHVLDVMREQSQKRDSFPILIFPEGTCINNTSLMMFRKGAFELGVTVQPIAIKYDLRLGDAFWNSQRCSFGHYMWMLLTSWAVWADVYYLEPMARRSDHEKPEQFAKRVKNEIALMGGFVNMDWDGNLKRTLPKPIFKEEQQTKYSESLIL